MNVIYLILVWCIYSSEGELNEPPGSFGSETPAPPGSETPASPGFETPASSGTETASSPGSVIPASSGSEVPASPGSETPVSSVSETTISSELAPPVSPGSETPASDGSGTPASADYETPALSGPTTPPSDGSATPENSESTTPDSLGAATTPSPGSALPPPLSLWPLCKTSFAYDVIQGVDGVHPKLDGCFKIDEKGHPELRYGALYFDDSSDYSYVDVPLQTNVSLNSFAITLQINPQISSSAIMYYKATTYKSYAMNYFYVRLLNSKVTVVVGGYVSASVYNYFPSSGGNWTSFAFGFDFESGNLSIYRNNELLLTKTSTYKDKKLTLPGVLRVGNPLMSIKDQFFGMMTCLSMYNVSKGFEDSASVLSHCNASWTSPPPVAPTCFYEEPVSLWPLDDVMYGTDIRTQTNPLNYKRCFRYSIPHSNLSNNAMKFDGSDKSLLQTQIKSRDLQQDFTLAAFMYFDEKSTGVVWHIAANQSDGISQIQLLINSYKLSVKLYSKGSICANFEVNKVLSMHTWYMVSVQRVAVMKKLSMVIGQTAFDISDTCEVSTLSQNLSSQFTIGGSFESSGNFRGSIRCLGFFDTWLHPTRVKERLTALCKESMTTVENPCDQLPLTKTTIFKKFQADAVPDLNLTPIKEIDTSGFSLCMFHCASTPFCRSLNFGRGKCILFDFVSKGNMRNESGVDYFIGG